MGGQRRQGGTEVSHGLDMKIGLKKKCEGMSMAGKGGKGLKKRMRGCEKWKTNGGGEGAGGVTQKKDERGKQFPGEKESTGRSLRVKGR